MKLEPSLTFATFIVGPSSARAVALARRASRIVRGTPNLVLLVGASGSGKTHLLHSMATDFLHRRPAARVRLLRAADFCIGYVNGLRSGHAGAFLRSLTHDCDALFVDELEDLTGKAGSLAPLRDAVALLVGRGKLVVLASAPTRDLAKLAPPPSSAILRLRTPTLAQRTTALRRLARARRARLTSEQLRFLARQARTIPDATNALECTLLLRELARDAALPESRAAEAGRGRLLRGPRVRPRRLH